MLQRLLLLPLLAPLLAVLLVGALNPRPWVALQLLIWRSPALPLGAWLGLAAVGGGALSAGATALALRGAPPPGGRPWGRRSRPGGRRQEEPIWPEATDWGEPGPEVAGRWEEARTDRPPAADWAGPSRAPGEPPPTLSVPFRILRRGSGAAAEPPGRASAGAAPRPGASSPAGAPAGGGGDGWDEPPDTDW